MYFSNKCVYIYPHFVWSSMGSEKGLLFTDGMSCFDYLRNMIFLCKILNSGATFWSSYLHVIILFVFNFEILKYNNLYNMWSYSANEWLSFVFGFTLYTAYSRGGRGNLVLRNPDYNLVLRTLNPTFHQTFEALRVEYWNLTLRFALLPDAKKLKYQYTINHFPEWESNPQP